MNKYFFWLSITKTYPLSIAVARHVIHAAKSKFKEIEGNQLDIGKESLEKMVQYPIRIPQLSEK
jgi:hypothetical protein